MEPICHDWGCIAATIDGDPANSHIQHQIEDFFAALRCIFDAAHGNDDCTPIVTPSSDAIGILHDIADLELLFREHRSSCPCVANARQLSNIQSSSKSSNQHAGRR